MALSYVGGTASLGESATLPTFTAGDLALVFAYRDGSSAAPGRPSGWTNVISSGATSNASRVGYRVLQTGDTTTGSWLNATEVQVHILRGQHPTTPVNLASQGGAGSDTNQISYAGFTLSNTSGTSWVIGFAGHRSATNVNTKAVSGMTTRSGSLGSLGAHTAEGVSSFSTSAYTTTVDAASGWRSYAVEVLADVPASTGTARLSLSAGEPPATRTNHQIVLRARTTLSGTIRAQLYEGATAIGSELESAALTSAFAEYTLAIADADAADIGNYSNLELRLYGYSADGDAAVFEVAFAEVRLPATDTATQYGTTSLALSATLTSNGTAAAAGSTETGVARLSLAAGFVPEMRTGHEVVLRARKTNAAHAGTLRMELWEGSSARTATLESDALTDSLAEYVIAIPEANAATIGSYADLELRLWGYSSAGDPTVFEVAEVELSLPGTGTGGNVTGQAYLYSSSHIGLGELDQVVYPGTAVYPHGLIDVTATSTIAAAGTSTHRYITTSLPLTFSVYSAGQTPPDRDGAAVLASVASLAAVGQHSALGAVTLASFASIGVEAPDATSHTDSAALVGSATVSAAGTVSAPPTPPTYVSYYETMPDLLAAIAYDTVPAGPFPEWTDVAGYVRTLSTKRGRQFELDRIETGELGATLSNLDGRFSPENASGPYYGDLIPSKRIRIGMQWGTADPADVFHGYLEGYPQEWPAYGADSVVQQRAVDAFFALSMTKLVPATTTIYGSIEAADTDIPVRNTPLPMPQVTPFTIRIDAEDMTVTRILPGWYIVTRGANDTTPAAHAVGSTVYADTVSFGEAYSDQRIRQVLEYVGLDANAYNLEPGQTLLSASGNLAGQTPLEHVNLVAEVEDGRFFAAADGRLTFHSRHHLFQSETAARATFGDGAGELGYQEIKITHEQERIYNIVRITAADGTVAEVRDEASITDHFERVLEKEWPLADANEALGAAQYLLRRYSRMQVRIPELMVTGQKDPDLIWPYLIALELGQRYRVIRRPATTSLNIADAVIDKELIVEGIAHSLDPGRAQTRIQLSLADTTHYWRLGVAGYSELGSTTRLIGR